MSESNFDPTTGGGSDVFVERSSQNWLQRLMGGVVATLFGFVLVIAASVLLFWNEGRSAQTAAALHEGAGLVVDVDPGGPDPANEGKLIHVAGAVHTGGPAADPEFGFDAQALKLQRSVEMYQWKERTETETQKKLGGGEDTVTRYIYSRDWSDKGVDSSRFRDQNGHRNPPMPGVRSGVFYPRDAKLGGFTLDTNALALLGGDEAMSPPETSQSRAQMALGPRARVAAGGVYAGADPDSPAVGDVRVLWRLTPVGDVSAVGRQTRGAVAPFVTSNGRELLMAENGIVDAALMFKHGQDENRLITWLIRGGGALAMFIGFAMMLSLLEPIADVIPFLGSLVGAGTFLVALLFTAALAPLIVAVAWIAYRPLVALGALAAGAVVVLFLREAAKRRTAPRSAARA